MKVNFTTKAPNMSGKVAICVKFTGSNNRNYRVIKGVRSQDLTAWNQEKQMFVASTEEAKSDNALLKKVKDDIVKIFETHHPANAKELLSLYGQCVADQKPLTFGEFIKSIIEEMRTGRGNKKPSRNYQTYINLLHKLEDEGRLIDIPVAEIDNSHFVWFSDYC